MTSVVSLFSASDAGQGRSADPDRLHRTVPRFREHCRLTPDTDDALAPHELALTARTAAGVRHDQRTRESFLFHSSVAASLGQWSASPKHVLKYRDTAAVGTSDDLVTGTSRSSHRDDDESGEFETCAGQTSVLWCIRYDGDVGLIARPAIEPNSIGPARFNATARALPGTESAPARVAADMRTLHLAEESYEGVADEIRVAHRAPDGTWTMES
jgi:hypothetical protein